MSKSLLDTLKKSLDTYKELSMEDRRLIEKLIDYSNNIINNKEIEKDIRDKFTDFMINDLANIIREINKESNKNITEISK